MYYLKTSYGLCLQLGKKRFKKKMEECTMLLNFYRYGASFFSFFKLLTARVTNTAVYVITENTIEMLHADECMRQKLKRIFYAMF